MPRGKFSASRRSNSAFAQGKGQDSGYGKWIEHGMILTYIKYHQVLSLLATVCQKKTAKDAVQWPKQNYAMLHVLELCNLCCKKGLSTLHDTAPNVINIFSRVKLETPAASFANDTLEIHRISSYTTLPVSKNYRFDI